MKVKTFLKEHKAEIVGVAVGTGIAVTAGVVGYNMGRFKTIKLWDKVIDSNEIALLMNASTSGADSAFGWITTDGVLAENLGKLGEKMIIDGAEGIKFTHFLAYGKE